MSINGCYSGSTGLCNDTENVMVITRSQARQLARNKPLSVGGFQGRGSDLPSEQDDIQEVLPQTKTPIKSVRQRGVSPRKTAIPEKAILLNWTPDTLPRRLRRNTVGGREGERVFSSKTRASTSGSERAESVGKESTTVTLSQRQTPKFGRQMANFSGPNKLRRTPLPSPKLAPQRTGRSTSPTVSEEIVQTLNTGSKDVFVAVETENSPMEEKNPISSQESAQEDGVATPGQRVLWYDRGGMLRNYLPLVQSGQAGRAEVPAEERQRQGGIKWISWIGEARRQGVEAQLPIIIENCKKNLNPHIHNYDTELSRMIFRAVAAEAVKRMPTESEMLYGIREGFILAMQLGDTRQIPAEIQDLHQKDKSRRGNPIRRADRERNVLSPREQSIEPIANRGEPPSKELHQLRLEHIMPMPRQSRYFTPEQSENESEVGIAKYVTRMPRDIPSDLGLELSEQIYKRLQREVIKVYGKNDAEKRNSIVEQLTGKILTQVEKYQAEKQEKGSKTRKQDPSPSPSSSSTSTDERRRRARREKEKKKDAEKKKENKRRRKRVPDGDDDPSNSSDGSSSDSDIGNKKYDRKLAETSSEESDRSERATRQQRKDFMAILKANAPKKYKGDRDPKILREWVNQVDHYMSMVKLTKRDEMRTILLLLEGDAMLWWRRNRKEFKRKGISSWKTIKRMIVDRFMPLGYRLMLEKQLREVCQRTSAREYASRFTHIIMQLPDYTDKQIISHFINGLKTAVRTQVISHDPTELEEAIRLAENVDDGIFAEQVAARRLGVPDPRVTRVTTYKVNQIEGVKKNVTSPGERKFPASIKCYNCGKLGHISRICRAPRRPQQQAAINESQKIQQVNVKREESPNDWKNEERSISNLRSEEITTIKGGIKNIPPKAGKLIVIYGHIGGKRAKILLDSGATASFVSEAFVKLHRLRTTTRAHPLRVFFADGHDEISLRLLPNVTLMIDGYQEATTFEVANIKYDCILGKNWHDDHKAITKNPQDTVQIELGKQTFVFHSVNTEKKLEERIVSTLEDISSHAMSKVVKRGDNEVYAVTVKERRGDEENPQTPVHCIQELNKAMEGFKRIFQESLPQDEGGVTNRVEHNIEVEPGAVPPVLPIYRMTQSELAILKKRLQELTEKGHIRPSSSPYAASALFVPKKSGELRMCVDYRMLNKQTIKNKYPLPLIDELLDKLRNAHYFSKLDLSDGYYQIPVKESDRAKTAFRTPYGHYEFTVMPFGLVNAPATFQRMMNDVLREFTNDFVVVYLDDIMIFSGDKEQHVMHLRKVFRKLMENKLYVKPSKSSYFQREAEYLGYIVREGKVTPSPDKVQAIKDWPTPLPSVTAVKSFLGMAQFYRRFVKDFAAIAKPLTELTKTTREFRWSEQAQQAVQQLKDELCKLPEMYLPDVQLPFILRTDASNFAIGAVLSQIRNNEEVPVAYFSRKLHGDMEGTKPDTQGISSPTGELAYPVHEQELLAIHDAMQKWRHYLLGNEFTIYTDHHPLKFFMSQKRLSPRQARWAEFLQQFNLHINYTPGKSNLVPDALSRRTDYANNVTAVEVSIDHYASTIMERLMSAYGKNNVLSAEVKMLQEGEEIENQEGRWKKKNSIIWKWVSKLREWRIWVPREEAEELIKEIHESPAVACGGMEKTLDYVERYFTWKGVTRDVKGVVERCGKCAQNKASSSILKAMLQPLPVPDEKWTHLSMDFITELPMATTGENAIFVVVDRLTKQAHFVPCRTTITAKETAQMFISEIWKLHGLPTAIVSDRDPRFISSFWEALTEQLKVTRSLSTAYHPESDGQTERTNRTIEQILRYFCADQQHKWKDHLAQAEFAYNNAKHTTTKVSPFYANYGMHPRVEFPQIGNVKNEAAQEFVQRLKEIQERLKRNIAAAQQRQQHYANRARREREFEEGAWVYLATAHLNLQLLTRKLAPRFIGPIRIVGKISKTAYRLEIPSYWRIHNVFYVGLLKECKKIPTGEIKLPLLAHEVEEFEVEEIIRHKETATGRKFLIKWKGYPTEENTWQTLSDLANAPRVVSQYFQKV